METSSRRQRRPRPPLDERSLSELALAYVSRFATSRGRLAAYLGRKLRERGWAGAAPADCAAVADRMAELGYVDDASFAEGRARSLGARGYGVRRLGQALHAAAIGEADRRGALAIAEEGAVEAALRFARRRRLGPFAAAPSDDPKVRDKAFAAMVRAGHSMGLARAVLALPPGAEIDPEALGEAR